LLLMGGAVVYRDLFAGLSTADFTIIIMVYEHARTHNGCLRIHSSISPHAWSLSLSLKIIAINNRINLVQLLFTHVPNLQLFQPLACRFFAFLFWVL
jgi:hypothetical protein